LDGLSPEAIEAFLRAEFPAVIDVGFAIERADADGVRLRMPTDERHLRPGGTVMGPTLMLLADTGAYVAILARRGRLVGAVTTSLEMHFLMATGPGDLITEASLLKLGRRLAVAVVDVRTAAGEHVAHATVTYALPETRVEPAGGQSA
jgi:uncharacterized protein (TIGR00369 family)